MASAPQCCERVAAAAAVRHAPGRAGRATAAWLGCGLAPSFGPTTPPNWAHPSPPDRQVILSSKIAPRALSGVNSPDPLAARHAMALAALVARDAPALFLDHVAHLVAGNLQIFEATGAGPGACGTGGAMSSGRAGCGAPVRGEGMEPARRRRAGARRSRCGSNKAHKEAVVCEVCVLALTLTLAHTLTHIHLRTHSHITHTQTRACTQTHTYTHTHTHTHTHTTRQAR
jgi:hypothetical protein